MRILLLLSLLLVTGTYAQVPQPNRTTTTSQFEKLYWKKTDKLNYQLYDNNGQLVQNTKDLKYLDTDSLGVLDQKNRDVYLLADFKNASSGTSGEAVIIARNVGKNFYLTNPYSFAFFENDNYITGSFSNINGSYVYYVEESSTSYFLEDIRSFLGWGCRSVRTLPYSADNTYWYRDVERKEYGVIKKGKTLDYSKVSSAKEGNDLAISVNGIKTYRLKGYYTAGSYDFKPTESYSSDTESATGCVSGDCTNGWGKYRYNNGYYDGFWLNSKKHGYGLYNWKDGGKYIGNWTNDKMEGYGVYIAKNNDNIIGQYRNGELNGLGLTVSGDTWKQGEYNDGKLVVAYDFYSTDNSAGCTAGDCYNKYGRYKWDNGDTFTGFFKNGKMHMGTYKFANGDKYSGMFNSNNQYHGTGRFFFSSGAYYGGSWVNGSYQGRGYYHDKDLKQQIGEWSSGQLVKKLK